MLTKMETGFEAHTNITSSVFFFLHLFTYLVPLMPRYHFLLLCLTIIIPYITIIVLLDFAFKLLLLMSSTINKTVSFRSGKYIEIKSAYKYISTSSLATNPSVNVEEL